MTTGNGTEGNGRRKKPYVKPVLECTAVFEASGATVATCCKLNASACKAANQSSLGKTQKTSTVS